MHVKLIDFSQQVVVLENQKRSALLHGFVRNLVFVNTVWLVSFSLSFVSCTAEQVYVSFLGACRFAKIGRGQENFIQILILGQIGQVNDVQLLLCMHVKIN
eukprot:TRINITY_DN1497_c0_g1_i4.p17 TRINITY_DN1497_c0_g1~~TRINITY_DN1497_c0_g1_i4.p17  ORF type:complete len:101 (-),score=2.07 TRINITY_DN1497_c0_g1_i4:2750-3052(-)